MLMLQDMIKVGNDPHRNVAAYQADMTQHGHARIDNIRGIHDATMLCCLFDWVPALRFSIAH